MAITGSCLCGAVTYQIQGQLRDARSCHCSTCRKAFSAPASAYALVDPKEFAWVSGKDLLSTYESNKDAGLQFCRICGSTLCGTYKGQIHGVTLGCTDGALNIKFGMHIFVCDKAAWETLPDDNVPRYEEGPPTNT